MREFERDVSRYEKLERTALERSRRMELEYQPFPRQYEGKANLPSFVDLARDINLIEPLEAFLMIEVLCLLSAFERGHHDRQNFIRRLKDHYEKNFTYEEQFEYWSEVLYGISPVFARTVEAAINMAHWNSGQKMPFENCSDPVGFYKEICVRSNTENYQKSYLETLLENIDPHRQTPEQPIGQFDMRVWQQVSSYHSRDQDIEVFRETHRHPHLLVCRSGEGQPYYFAHKSEFGYPLP